MSSEPTGSPTRADQRLDRVVDDADRIVAFERYRPEHYGGLVDMYDDFPPEQRAQGLPPASESGITEWLAVLLDHVSVVAVHDGMVVGHAALVPDDGGDYELGVFVDDDYQNAGIGSALLEAAFEYARTLGITDVWLCVARSNHRARHVYDSLGFTEAGGKGRSLRLTLSL
jgi:GNAT superfamily N-acetyltransferase